MHFEDHSPLLAGEFGAVDDDGAFSLRRAGEAGWAQFSQESFKGGAFAARVGGWPGGWGDGAEKGEIRFLDVALGEPRLG